MIALAARWALVPAWVRQVLAIAALLALALIAAAVWLHRHDNTVITTHDAAANVKAAATTAAAGAAAHQTVTTAATETEKSNAQARDAAAGSDDPLRSGLDSLRRNAGGPRPAPAR